MLSSFHVVFLLSCCCCCLPYVFVVGVVVVVMFCSALCFVTPKETFLFSGNRNLAGARLLTCSVGWGGCVCSLVGQPELQGEAGSVLISYI